MNTRHPFNGPPMKPEPYSPPPVNPPKFGPPPMKHEVPVGWRKPRVKSEGWSSARKKFNQ